MKVDKGFKLISTYMLTPPSEHDSQSLETVIDEANAGQSLYGDSAYIGQKAGINCCQMSNEILEKGTKGNPLTD